MPSYCVMQHACMNCRKVFKKPGDAEGRTYPCPECSQPMTPMGVAFRAPKRNDLEQWEKVRLLVEAGIRFDVLHEFGNWSEEDRLRDLKPQRLQDVPAFLEVQRLKGRSPGGRLLEVMQQHRAGAKTAILRAKGQGRLKRINTESGLRFELHGRELRALTSVMVFVNGQWHNGTFNFSGDGREPVEAYVHVQGDETTEVDVGSVLITAKTFLRWPDE